MNSKADMEEFHRTNDMALVTFLKMQGHAVQMVQWDGNTCFWYFRLSDGLKSLVGEFTEGRGLVEPREYNRMFSLTKREFYDEKDRHPTSRR